MATSYETLYSNLLPKFKDYDIPVMTVEEVKDLLHDFLIPAVARFHICRQDLKDRNDVLQQFNIDLSDNEIEILSNYMLLEFIDSTYIRTPILLKVALPSVDTRAFSLANHLDKLLSMHSTYLRENESLLARYAWLGGKVSGISLGAGYKKSKLY